MQLELNQYDFILPPSLIAQYPLKERSASRLLCLHTTNNLGADSESISPQAAETSDKIVHRQFRDLPSLLQPNDLVVFNNTKVIKARLFGEKISGGKVEIFVERIINDHQVLAQVRANKKIKIGMEIFLVDGQKAVVIDKQQDFFVVQLFGTNNETVLTILQKYGHVPLPPYVERADEGFDEARYQSIFAERDGAVAAPTASLHFDEEIITALKEKNIAMAFVTLHVGAGTFQPVRVNDITQHKMHAEYMELDEEVCAKIKETKARGGRVVAIGTTSVRCLETAAQHAQMDSAANLIKPFRGDTDIFIYPGYTFRCVDVLITNFHLPKSTLLMLVCAFAGYENVMRAYREAVAMQYRFFSYGDAMYVEKKL